MRDAAIGFCVITSNPFSDPDAIRITNSDLQAGSLSTISFARPLKLFTAEEGLIVKRIAILKDETFRNILAGTIKALQRNMPDE